MDNFSGEEKKTDNRNAHCCWRCEPCDKNEIVAGGKCEPCDKLDWPNSNRTQCVPIEPDYLYYDRTAGLVILVLISVAFVILILFTAIFIKYHHHKAIKASSPK